MDIFDDAIGAPTQEFVDLSDGKGANEAAMEAAAEASAYREMTATDGWKKLEKHFKDQIKHHMNALVYERRDGMIITLQAEIIAFRTVLGLVEQKIYEAEGLLREQPK